MARHALLLEDRAAVDANRLGADAELYKFSKGNKLSFSLATSRSWKNGEGVREEHTTWHRIVVWGNRAEQLLPHLTKGKKVYVEGRIDQRSWEDEDGNKRYMTEIIADGVEFVSSAQQQAAA